LQRCFRMSWGEPARQEKGVFVKERQRSEVWRQLVAQLREEFLALDAAEIAQIQQIGQRISLLQQELDRLFDQGDGVQQCRECQGDCCACGHNHLTLANVLILMANQVAVPSLDFKQACPLLGEQGCHLPASYRPYNCISFLCDRIEEKLSRQQTERFYQIDRELRTLYAHFAQRYAGGSLSGLLVAQQRLQGQPFLRRIDLD